MFVTLFCAILETATGQFSFANAGHNPPLLLGADGKHDFLNVKKGLVAGIIEDTRYPLATRRLSPGESVLLYTDGVTEAMNGRDEFYSEERFLTTVRERSWHDSRSLVERVRTSIAEFAQSAPQADDITMLAVRYCGSALLPAQNPDFVEPQ
jgi:sigma-B regulation protein RsbU (phosphoserine phosphatase)